MNLGILKITKSIRNTIIVHNHFHHKKVGHPLVKDPAVQPVVSGSVVHPVLSSPVVHPVLSSPVVDPVVRGPVVYPVVSDVHPALSNQVVRGPSVHPVVEGPVVHPLVSSPVVHPVLSSPSHNHKQHQVQAPLHTGHQEYQKHLMNLLHLNYS